MKEYFQFYFPINCCIRVIEVFFLFLFPSKTVNIWWNYFARGLLSLLYKILWANACKCERRQFTWKWRKRQEQMEILKVGKAVENRSRSKKTQAREIFTCSTYEYCANMARTVVSHKSFDEIFKINIIR